MDREAQFHENRDNPKFVQEKVLLQLQHRCDCFWKSIIRELDSRQRLQRRDEARSTTPRTVFTAGFRCDRTTPFPRKGPISTIMMAVYDKFPLVLLLLLLVVSKNVAAKKDEYPEGQVHSTPINLDIETFPKALQDPNNKFWFFKFYAPWCGHW